MPSSLSITGDVAPAVYPQRRDEDPGKLEQLVAPAVGTVTRALRSRQARFAPLVEQIGEVGEALAHHSDDALHTRARELRRGLRSSSEADVALGVQTFALVRELADRILGLRPYDVQLVGGWIMLEGMVAEMQTGEGKTLTATLPAAAMALAGKPVHVVSVNDYLVARDAETMGPLYRALGLSVGVIQEEMGPDERRAAYGCDITYVSNKQLTFDYLKDRIAMGRHRSDLSLRLDRLRSDRPRLRELVLRGLHYAIVDEIDSVLVDEARTPLIISREIEATDDELIYERALELVAGLEEGRDFTLDRPSRQAKITDEGYDALERNAHGLGGVWTSRLYREELCEQALAAMQLYERGIHYLVVDDKVQIVDEFTGRIMADRSWQRGLHQMLEVKEGCTLSSHKETLARISYQRFFRRYLRLAGMTGTAQEISGELWSTYGLAVVTVPTRKPLRREPYEDRIFATKQAKYEAILERVRELNEQGRPVLVGTRSVSASEELSAIFEEAGLSHRVLNARQNAEEAEIVADAGQPGRITVATNMAGRGTDIVLGSGVAEQGGLHVIATEFHEARRIDRQLFGRAGRQGDPGSYEVIASLEDDLARAQGAALADLLRAGGSDRDPGRLTRWLRSGAMRYWQRSIEARHAKTRRRLLKMDERLGKALAFSGQAE